MKIELRVLGPNQTEVCLGRNVLFFSYNTVVVAGVDGVWYVTNSKHSNTTTKHINEYFGNFTKITAVSQKSLESIVDGLA